MMKRCRLYRFVFIALSVAGICVASLSPESAGSVKPRVAVFGFLNLTGEDSFDIPTDTADDNLFPGISLLGTNEATMPASIPRSYVNDSHSRRCDANAIDTILFGTIVKSVSDDLTAVMIYSRAR